MTTLKLGGVLAGSRILILPNANKSVAAWSEVLVETDNRRGTADKIKKTGNKQNRVENLKRNRTNDRGERIKIKKTNKGKIEVGQSGIYIKEKRMKDTMKSKERRHER